MIREMVMKAGDEKSQIMYNKLILLRCTGQRAFAGQTWADTPVRYHAPAGITMIELDK